MTLMSKPVNRHWQAAGVMTRTLFLFAALLALAGCDGGLFGTGDGSDIVELDASAVGDQRPAEPTPGAPTASPGPEQNEAGNSVDSEEPAGSIVFDNLVAGSATEEPALSVLNVATRTLNLISETDNTLLFNEPLLSGSTSDTLTLSLGENFLDLVDAQTQLPVFSIRPLNAGAFSVTTLIARDQDNQNIDVIALTTLTVSDTPSVAQIRLVQADRLNNTDTSTTFVLRPAGEQPGDAEVSFTNVSAATASLAQYRVAGEGSYELVDSLGRIEPVELTLSAGEVYTIVLIDTATSALLVQTDTDLFD